MGLATTYYVLIVVAQVLQRLASKKPYGLGTTAQGDKRKAMIDQVAEDLGRRATLVRWCKHAKLTLK